MTASHKEILAAALSGYDVQIAKLQEQRNAVAAQLGITQPGRGRRPRAAASAHSPARAIKKRRMSAEGRARIAEATRKRWADFRKLKVREARETSGAGAAA